MAPPIEPKSTKFSIIIEDTGEAAPKSAGETAAANDDLKRRVALLFNDKYAPPPTDAQVQGMAPRQRIAFYLHELLRNYGANYGFQQDEEIAKKLARIVFNIYSCFQVEGILLPATPDQQKQVIFELLDLELGSGRETYFVAPAASKNHRFEYEQKIIGSIQEKILSYRLQEPDFFEFFLKKPQDAALVFDPTPLDQFPPETLRNRIETLREIATKVRKNEVLLEVVHEKLQEAVTRQSINEKRMNQAAQTQRALGTAMHQAEVEEVNANAQAPASHFARSIQKAGVTHYDLDRLRQFYVLGERAIKMGYDSLGPQETELFFVLLNEITEASANDWGPEAKQVFSQRNEKVRRYVRRAMERSGRATSRPEWTFYVEGELNPLQARALLDRSGRSVEAIAGRTSERFHSGRFESEGLSDAMMNSLEAAPPAVEAPRPNPVKPNQNSISSSSVTHNARSWLKNLWVSLTPKVTLVTAHPTIVTSKTASKIEATEPIKTPILSGSQPLILALQGLGLGFAGLTVYATWVQRQISLDRQASRGSFLEARAADVSVLSSVVLFATAAWRFAAHLPSNQNLLNEGFKKSAQAHSILNANSLKKASKIGMTAALVLGVSDFARGLMRLSSTLDYGYGKERFTANAITFTGDISAGLPFPSFMVLGMAWSYLGRSANNNLEAQGAAERLAQAIVLNDHDKGGLIKRFSDIKVDQVNPVSTAIKLSKTLRNYGYFNQSQQLPSEVLEVLGSYRDVLWERANSQWNLGVMAIGFNDSEAIALMTLGILCHQYQGEAKPSIQEIYEIAKRQLGSEEALEKAFNHFTHQGYRGPTWEYISAVHQLKPISDQELQKVIGNLTNIRHQQMDLQYKIDSGEYTLPKTELPFPNLNLRAEAF